MNQLDIMTFGSVVLNHSWWLCFECASLELIFADNIHDLLFGTNVRAFLCCNLQCLLTHCSI